MKIPAALSAMVVALLAPAAAQATVVDLTGPAGHIRVDGQAMGDESGWRVADAGDVNGDGTRDFIIGATFASNNGRSRSGSAYVIYGGRNLAHVDLGNLGAAGFRIDGAAANDQVGFDVAGGGDFNGDGIADVIVGGPSASNNAREHSGSAYVIYGGHDPDPADIDLANITTTDAARGMRIDGAALATSAGDAVSFADLNGDGVSDAVIAADAANNNGRNTSGSVYVVYGQATPDPADFDLANITTTDAARGFRIDGAAARDQIGQSIANAGDVNQDGVADLLIGAVSASTAKTGSGAAYFIYGQKTADPADLDLANIDTTQAARGLRIVGATASEGLGYSVSAAGDLNGDGIDDVILGAVGAANNGRLSAGAAYVIYGQATPDPADLDLANIDTTDAGRGFRIDGAQAAEVTGAAVAGGTDLNGDGRPDAIVGAVGASNNGRLRSGSVYVIFGQATPDPANLDLAAVSSAPSSRGVRIDGEATTNLTGYALAAGGDLNGDGHPDAIISAIGASPNRFASGSTYVVDLAAPDTAIDSAPTVTRDSTPTFIFHSTEPGSFLCSIDRGAAAFSACTGPGGSHTASQPLPDGTYAFRVAAVDRGGNADPTPATRSFTIDTTAPQTRITSHPRATLTLKRHSTKLAIRFTFAASERNAAFTCRLDRRPASRCVSPVSFAVSKGRHTFSVVASDTLGNTDSTAARFSVRVTAPNSKPRRVRRRAV